mmetsp:Transcript_11672/g.22205  ORF Transcript_11672/g.22205 Transcript_11672/m.22205 type:complete len:568 (-) Transcript_11672:437-2140(-)
MRKHPGPPSLVIAYLDFLALICKDETSQFLVSSMGGFSAALEYMKQHANDTNVQKSALTLFEGVAMQEVCQAPVVEAGGVTVICTAMANCSKDIGVQKRALISLSELCSSNSQAASQAKESKVLDMVQAAVAIAGFTKMKGVSAAVSKLTAAIEAVPDLQLQTAPEAVVPTSDTAKDEAAVDGESAEPEQHQDNALFPAADPETTPEKMSIDRMVFRESRSHNPGGDIATAEHPGPDETPVDETKESANGKKEDFLTEEVEKPAESATETKEKPFESAVEKNEKPTEEQTTDKSGDKKAIEEDAVSAPTEDKLTEGIVEKVGQKDDSPIEEVEKPAGTPTETTETPVESNMEETEKPAAENKEAIKLAAAAEEKTADGKPAQETVEQKPAAEGASEEKAAEEKPAAEKPTEEKLVAEETSEETPTEEKPGDKNSEKKATAEEISEEKSAEGEPSAEEPTEEKRVADETLEGTPTEEKPAAEEPGEKSSKEKTTAEETSEETSEGGESIQSCQEKPTAESISEEKSAEENPAAEEPREEKPAAKETSEKKTTEENSQEKPSAEKPPET